MPNLWGASPVGRDEGSRSYMTQKADTVDCSGIVEDRRWTQPK